MTTVDTTTTNADTQQQSQTTKTVPEFNPGRNPSLAKLEEEIKQLEEQRNADQIAAVRGQEPSPVTSTEPVTPTVPPEGTASPANPDDGLATLTDDLPATTEEEQTYRKRYTDLKSHYDKATHEQRLRIAALERQVSEEGNLAPQTEAELEEFRQKNPDMFATMEALLNKNKTSLSEAQVLELQEEIASIRQEKAVAVIQSKHSDFYDVVSSSAWTDWLDKQPTHIQSMVKGNTDDAASFTRAIDLYKFDNGVVSTGATPSVSNSNNTTTQQAPSAADAISTRGTGEVSDSNKRIWTTTEIDKMSLAEYELFQEDLAIAQAEGRIRRN